MNTTTTTIEAGSENFTAAVHEALDATGPKLMVCDRHGNEGVCLSGIGARRHSWLTVKFDKNDNAYVGSGNNKQFASKLQATEFVGTGIKIFKLTIDWKFSPVAG